MSKLKLYPLSEGWIPPNLLIRDQQFNELLENIEKGYHHNYWIYGDRGLGKTLTATMLQRMKKNVFYHNFKTPRLREEIKGFLYALKVKKRTYEREYDAMLRGFENAGCDKEVTIIFDDIEELKQFIKRDFDVFLHGLWETLTRREWKFSIHLISVRDPFWVEKKLSKPTLSRLGLRPLVFPPYLRDEVRLLLEQRLNYIEGLEWDEGAILFISEAVADLGGDFREALRYARNVIEKTGKLTLEGVEPEYISLKGRFYVQRIKQLPYDCALMLAAIVIETARRHRSTDVKGMLFPASWDRIKDTYAQLCRKYGMPLPRKEMLYYWLEKLWFSDWVDKFTLARRHEWNYVGKRSLFIRLEPHLPEIIEAIRQIDWTERW